MSKAKLVDAPKCKMYRWCYEYAHYTYTHQMTIHSDHTLSLSHFRRKKKKLDKQSYITQYNVRRDLPFIQIIIIVC